MTKVKLNETNANLHMQMKKNIFNQHTEEIGKHTTQTIRDTGKRYTSQSPFTGTR